ncbi:MAG: membrane protein insertion efficiency factor YidD [Arcobacteraceae bacterium]|nr:membrane protein insertion efficiency factor YidD [Arcobacteraceae bacterium]
MDLRKVLRYLPLKLIQFYQKYLTILSFGSCRYIPSCSQYAVIQFEYNNFFQALYYSIMRILKCNQLFDGGFDHPIIKYQVNKGNFNKIKIKYWLIPMQNSKFKIVKNWDRDIK